uniref:Uncharacterized protein n=1 Tax=Rhizophora mucronata TaxID=61149 RepID=A0A2P2N2I3_RHIMU
MLFHLWWMDNQIDRVHCYLELTNMTENCTGDD